LRDVTLGLLDYVRKADEVFVELYTSLVPDLDLRALEELAGRRVEVVTRREVEGAWLYSMLERARERLIVLLSPGDPFVATTHAVIKLEAAKRGVDVVYLPSPSVVSAVCGVLGLDVYKFCRPVTIVRPRPGYFSLTPYWVLLSNLRRGLHTLFLLELDADEGYAMRAEEAVELMREMEGRVGAGIIDERTLFVAVACATSPRERVRVLKVGSSTELGPPPHVLVVPGLLNPVEAECLQVVAGASREDVEAWVGRVRSLVLAEREGEGGCASPS